MRRASLVTSCPASCRVIAALLATAVVATLAAPVRASADESARWVLQNGSDLIVDRFGSSDMVLVTGIPAGGGIVPSSDVFVVPNADWTGRDNEELHDISNASGIPNTVVGYEVIEQPIYLPYMRTGAYDVVFDNDQNGRYDAAFDEVVGFDADPGFTVYYDGNHAGIDKAALKQRFAEPVFQAAKTAIALHAVVGSLEIIDTGLGVLVPAARLGNSVYGLRQNAADVATAGHYRTEIADSGMDLTAEFGIPSGTDWGAAQVKSAAENFTKALGGIIADPPDPDYGTIAEPDPVADVFPEMTADPLYNTMAALSNSLIQAAGESRALLHDIERMDGAAGAGATTAIRAQAQALQRHGAELRATLAQLATRARGFANELRAESAITSLSDAQRTLLAEVQQRVATFGFSEAELAKFHDAGVPEEVIAQFRDDLLRTPADELTGTLDATLDGIATAADEGRAGVLDAENQAANLADALTPNTAPDAQPDELSLDAGDTATVDVLANDRDEDGDALTVTDATQPAMGTVTCAASGSCVYTANRSASGTDGFTYTVQDARGATSTATVQIAVNAKNFPPDVVPDTLVLRRGQERTVEVLSNDSDPNGDGIQVVSNTQPTHGSATCEGAGTCHVTADADYAGQDTFTYTAQDAHGATATGTVSVTVNADNTAPVAAVALGELHTAQDSTLTFDASPSHDEDGTIVAYRWDFGDGATSDGAQPWAYHAYGHPGTFTAHLTVTDDAGATAETDVTVTVDNVAPSLATSVHPRAPVGRERPYAVSVLTGADEPTTLQTDFGDGTAPETRQVTGSTTSTITHAYATAGTYTINYTLTDSQSETATGSLDVTVQDAVADAGDDRTASEGDAVAFGGTTTEPDVYTSVSWDFGDGTPAVADRAPAHVYRDNGTYVATVTVTDDAGTRTDSATITVTNAPPTAVVTTGDARPGAPVSLRAFGSDPGPDDELTYHWAFGDGATGTGRAIDHTYAAAGSYDAVLTVTDDDGGSASVTRRVNVRGPGGARDTRGTDFWLAFPTNYSGPPTLVLFLAGATATHGTVEVPGLGFSVPFDVTPGEVTKVPLPADTQLQYGPTDPQTLAVHVTADDDVSVYGLNRIQYTTDAYLGLPTDALGTRYRIMSYTPAFDTASPEAAVVATRNDTTVTITPTVGLNPGHPAHEPFTVHLDLGEAYQLRGAGDVTGTVVEADRPVAVFGAHVCAQVPLGTGYCDHLLEEMPPTDAWGRSFVTMPLATRSGGDTFRILADEDDTNVSIDGEALPTLQAGEQHERLIAGAATITSTKPVLVAQYSNGSQWDGTISDPFMVIIPPFEQFQADYTVSTPSDGFRANFLNLTVPRAATSGVRVDGQVLDADGFTRIGDSDFAGRQVPVEQGDHVISGTAPLGVVVYGYDADDSYGYSGGYAIGRVATVTQLAISPADEELDVDGRGCVTAVARTGDGVAVADVRVDFVVTGANAAQGFTTTEADGGARFCWDGNAVGDDAVAASIGTVEAHGVKHWRPKDRAPSATDDELATDAGTPVEVAAAELLANDHDDDGDALTVTAVRDAEHGTVALVSGGRVRFTPSEGFSGSALFMYDVNDGRGMSAAATVRVTVRPVPPAEEPKPPSPEPPSTSVPEPTTLPAPTPTPPSAPVSAASAPATPAGSALLLACANRPLVLEDVVTVGGRVRLVGIADRSLAGRRVDLVFASTGKVVAHATVSATGGFAATAPLPPRRLRATDAARYQARIGTKRSLNLKLTRRMQVTRMVRAGRSVTITGRILPPLATAAADRVVVVQRIVSCQKAEDVAKITASRAGTFTAKMTVPAGATGVVYRLRTRVTNLTGRGTVTTFSLPRAIDF